MPAPFRSGQEAPASHAHHPLKISADRRHLVRADGTPFFWLADTAWELFHRLDFAEATHYLERRAAQGFNVIQAVALAELDGLDTPNAHGHRPLLDHDPARPAALADGEPGDDYWRHVDRVIVHAARLGLTVALLPTWGDKWHKSFGIGPEVFTPANAEIYGEWIARRYRDKPIVWVLGGDRPPESETHLAIIRAMAAGLRRGHGGAQLMTFHPPGGRGSAEWFHNEDWLDFNLRQNGHAFTYPRYANTRADYEHTPVKPVIDGEPLYEDHPLDFKAPEHGHSVAADVRRALYWDLFAGACGHTYGHHSVWQFFAPGRDPKNHPLMPWTEALDRPGATQMIHGRRLLESRPMLERVPDDELLAPIASEPGSVVPGAGIYRFAATRDAAGRYAMIYAPVGRRFAVRLEKLAGPTLRAWWFDPRSGAASPALDGEFPNTGQRAFTPPTPGEALDWVLVIDQTSQGYGPPGAAPAP